MPDVQSHHLVLNLISAKEANIAKALRFGRKFLAAGWPVTLSISLESVCLLDPQVKLGPCPVTAKPLINLLDAFISEGGAVLVGAECLKLAGLGAEHMRAGMVPAEISLWRSTLEKPGTMVFTY